MKLVPLVAFPLGLMAVVYGLRGKSLLLNGEPSDGLERAVTVGAGLLLMALGFAFGFLVLRLVFK